MFENFREVEFFFVLMALFAGTVLAAYIGGKVNESLQEEGRKKKENTLSAEVEMISGKKSES